MVLRPGVREHQEEHGHKPWHSHDRQGEERSFSQQIGMQGVKRAQADAGNGETEEVMLEMVRQRW